MVSKVKTLESKYKKKNDLINVRLIFDNKVIILEYICVKDMIESNNQKYFIILVEMSF